MAVVVAMAAREDHVREEICVLTQMMYYPLREGEANLLYGSENGKMIRYNHAHL